jgi:hypothetical protein
MPNLSGGLKDAFENYGRSHEDDPGSQDSQQPEKPKGGTDHHSVHHANHGDMHSIHKIGHDGKAESSTHKAGEGGSTCPLCGQEMSGGGVQA